MALSFIKSSGNIITEDFCMALANETKAEYVKDKSFGAEIKKVDDVIASTFEKLRERWEENRTQIIGNEYDNATLRKKWLLPFLEVLDYQPVFITSNIKSESGIEYQIPYKGWDSEYAPMIHMVNTTQDFDTKDKHSRTHSNKSPQDCLQQFLNTSHHQWAILINGKKVRLLRDFYHSITKGFLEFDLESIFETANSEQFRVLFRILHASRIENQYQGKHEIEYDEEGNPLEVDDNCLLESFHNKSRETGVKVGNKLRDQVIEAIEKLGNGFAESLDPDEFQNGKVKGFYAEILNIIYRLLFLMFAEQKGWLPVRNSIYARTYSLNALREMAERGNYSHDEEHDLWEGLKITFKLVANGYEFKNGDKINAFGGQLFSNKKIAVIKDLTIKNKFLLDAIYRLSYFKLDNLSNRINYANLAIDELGSVYESLLDYEPKLSKEHILVNKREIKRGEFYLDDRGTDRKTTGSYYTDSRLVAQLIESALVPVINNALEGKQTIAEKVNALLDLKVVDIACGSGAFICAALEKMGEQLALIRMGDEERPTEDQLREAKRDVLLHCIYGVDLNPMALELAKFSLWITASLPDMPLTFLDHKLKCGNSLIGATPELITKGIPEEAYKPVGNDNPAICIELKKKVRKEQEILSRVSQPSVQYGLQFKRNETDELLRLREVLNNRKQEEVSDVDLAEQEYHQLEKMERKFKDWLMADVWTSAFFIDKTEINLEFYPTNVTLENLRENQTVKPELIENILKIADNYNFFHYHLEFPEVFNKGGFDCFLGNPPWEKVQPEQEQFFAPYYPDISSTKDSERRNQKIERLKVSDFNVYNFWEQYKKSVYKFSNFLIHSGKYPLSSIGNRNLYRIFTDAALTNLSKNGRIGFIVQSGIYSDDMGKLFFEYLLENNKIVSLFDFENHEGYFDIHRMMRYTLLTLSHDLNSLPQFSFLLWKIEELLNPLKRFNITYEEVKILNPNTKNCPQFKNRIEADLALKIYKNKLSEVLHDERNKSPYRFVSEMINISRAPKELFNGINVHDLNYIPVYEAKNIYNYNHRFATFDLAQIQKDIEQGNALDVSLDNFNSYDYEIQNRYYVPKKYYEGKVNDEYKFDWYVGIRGIASSTNERTLISAIIPGVAIGNSINFIEPDTEKDGVILCANLNSFILDFIMRTKVSNNNISLYIIKQLPIINSNKIPKKALDLLLENTLKLSNTSMSLKKLNNIKEIHPVTNILERFKLICINDAIFFRLYDLCVNEIDYIMESFPIIKRKDIAKYGSYRTKETILQLYDEFAWVREEINQQQTIKTKQV
jgi:hypothetical protein